MRAKHLLILCTIAFFACEICCVCFIDRPVSLFLQSLDRQHPEYINFFRAYTDLGKSAWYLWPSGLGIIFCAVAIRLKRFAPQRRQLASWGNHLSYFFICIALSGIITDLLKILIGRGRPVGLERFGLYEFHPFRFSDHWHAMPSGHTTTATVLAWLGCQLAPRAGWIWLILGFMLILSRVMVNAHFVGDVIAGIFVGSLTVITIRRLWHGHGMNLGRQRIFPIDKRMDIS